MSQTAPKPETLQDAVTAVIDAAKRIINDVGLIGADERQSAMNAAMQLWATTRQCQQPVGLGAIVATMGGFQATEDTSPEEIAEAHKKVEPYKLRQAADILEGRSED